MPIYCKVTRGNHVESQHSIYAVAVNEVGEIIFSKQNNNNLKEVEKKIFESIPQT